MTSTSKKKKDTMDNEKIYLTAQYCADHNINIMTFLGLKSDDPDTPFDDRLLMKEDVQNAIRKQYKKNLRKYHSDNNDNPEYVLLYNINQAAYEILTNIDYYELFKSYYQGLLETKTDIALKDRFNDTDRDDIKNLIKQASNGKSFDELSKEISDKKVKEISSVINNNIFDKPKEEIVSDIDTAIDDYEKLRKAQDSRHINSDLYGKSRTMGREEFMKHFNDQFNKLNTSDDQDIKTNQLVSYEGFGDLTQQLVQHTGTFELNNDYSTIHIDNNTDQWAIPSAGVDFGVQIKSIEDQLAERVQFDIDMTISNEMSRRKGVIKKEKEEFDMIMKIINSVC